MHDPSRNAPASGSFTDAVAALGGWVVQDVLDSCRRSAQTIATVESCTGGLLAAMLTEVPGASAIYIGGWVVYSDAMKIDQLGVPRDVIGTHGAVSGQCAEALAKGGIARSGASHCLAITGVAGPHGATDDKPVGTVWIAHAAARAPDGDHDADVRQFLFPGDRAAIRRASALIALAMLHRSFTGETETLPHQVQ